MINANLRENLWAKPYPILCTNHSFVEGCSSVSFDTVYHLIFSFHQTYRTLFEQSPALCNGVNRKQSRFSRQPLRCSGSRRYDLAVNSQTSILGSSHAVNKPEWTERALTPLQKAKQAHTSRNAEMPIPFQWPSPTPLPALWRVIPAAPHRLIRVLWRVHQQDKSTFSRRSRLAVQSAVLGRPVTLIHIVHLSVCVMDLTALYVSSCQTSNPVNLLSLAFVGMHVYALKCKWYYKLFLRNNVVCCL